MPKKDSVFLEESFFIGKGANMAVYINPINPSQCIKIQIGSMREYDLEMTYRKSRQRRRLPQSSLLVKYYGEVETNLGTGYVYERVTDYDGTTSMLIHDLIQLEKRAREKGLHVKQIAGTEKELPQVKEALSKLFENVFQDRVLINDSDCHNYMIQFSTPSSWTIRIIDGLGYRVLVPFAYYIDFFTVLRLKQYLPRFVDEIATIYYPGFFSDEEIESYKKSLGRLFGS